VPWFAKRSEATTGHVHTVSYVVAAQSGRKPRHPNIQP
jgi:hypothetical protein